MSGQTTRDCSCFKCVRACKHIPGWFAPGELEKAAAFCEAPSVEDFKRDFLKEVGFLADDQWIEIWRPRMPGYDDHSVKEKRCVFLSELDRCTIHPVKPMECREALLCERDQDIRPQIEALWRAKERA